ncbi:hypothetical protein [Rhizobium sp. CECT 9324]|uniref:helix-turn-helix transcriptional regulator n=1 Tax=Rhizobium sp. CECT 9324 TaxID=2845820 RepID=UPI001E61D5F4|nr:hypothetical protein [Rhizobium sp. CECT 9324]CAH0343024.1 hypothetical protein RHI9324_04757 [Rhizobium sp. CECT 9324]
MARDEQVRRATDPNSLRSNGYARAKSTLVDIEGDFFPSAEAADPELADQTAGIRPPSPVASASISSDQFLTDRDVAERYKVKKQTIWRWAKSSRTFPKPFKIEGTTRWSSKELDEHDSKIKEARR